MNVAMSRAKSKLIIVGSLAFLKEAVRAVNPDAGEHDLSFIDRMTETIARLEKEKRPDGTACAMTIDPATLAGPAAC